MELTTAQIAKKFGVTSSRVLAIARSRKTAGGKRLIDVLSRKVGQMRVWVPSAPKRLKSGARGVRR